MQQERVPFCLLFGFPNKKKGKKGTTDEPSSTLNPKPYTYSTLAKRGTLL